MELCPLAPEWGDIASWADVGVGALAAIATVIAVVVALTAAKREHDRTISLRDAEWAREEAARTRRAAVYAQTFNRELLQGAVPLISTVRQYSRLLATGQHTVGVEMIASGIEVSGHLAMLRRMADRLDDFSEREAVELLNVLSAWERVTSPVPAGLKTVNERQQATILTQRIVEIDLVLQLFRELQNKLRRTAEPLGFVEDGTWDEMRGAAATARAAIYAKLGIPSPEVEQDLPQG